MNPTSIPANWMHLMAKRIEKNKIETMNPAQRQICKALAKARATPSALSKQTKIDLHTTNANLEALTLSGRITMASDGKYFLK